MEDHIGDNEESGGVGGRSPSEGAPVILRMVVRARRGDALRPWGVSEMSMETLPILP